MNQHENSDINEANAFLRERYLYFLTSMCGKTAKVRMFDKTEVSCVIKATDINFENVMVSNLKTPLPEVMPHAILRTNDIINITLKD
ncbi:unnamed protein product [Brassicogethes aeneus]|uniref:Gem-associated protein 7 n=1 Tax=Brassicogethes aeneus TaxID=1431903 RepID=A0A9P0BDJ3_BRAAE|nr:unnamed protein product [Brassicogethes aeneus]